MNRKAEIRNLSTKPYGRIDGYGEIEVTWGDRIYLPEIMFDWRGDAQRIHVCWAPKKKDPSDFNNGANIPGGPTLPNWGYVPLDMDYAVDWDPVHVHPTPDQQATVLITEAIHGRTSFHTWIWVCGDPPSTQESDLWVLDTDANVFDVIPTAIQNLEVGYAVVG